MQRTRIKNKESAKNDQPRICALRLFISMCMIIGMVGNTSTVVYGKTSDNRILKERVGELIEDAMTEEMAVGMSVAAIKNTESDTLVEYKNYGYQDRRNGVFTSQSTVYQLGSTTKAFTALALLLLEEDNQISLEEPISTYVPWVTLYYKEIPREITINQVIHHTSGISDVSIYPNIPVGNKKELRHDTVKMLDGSELAFEPGTQVMYSNMGYNLLGCVIEKASGMSYEAYIKSRILEPLGMFHSTCSLEEAQASGNLAKQYMPFMGHGVEYNAPFYYGAVPDGYLFSTAEDMQIWMMAQMGMLEVPEKLARLIEKSHTVENDIVYRKNDNKGYGYYAYGWIVYPKVNEITHTGLNTCFCSNVTIRLSEKRAVCTLSNSPVDHVVYASDLIMRDMYGENMVRMNIGTYGKQDRLACAGIVVILIAVALSIALGIRYHRKIERGVEPESSTWIWIRKILYAVALLLLLLLSFGFIFISRVIYGVGLKELWTNNPRTVVMALELAALYFGVEFVIHIYSLKLYKERVEGQKSSKIELSKQFDRM